MDTLPNKDRKCHRCNFEKSCRDLVTSEACQRWVKLPWKDHPLQGGAIDVWNCIDDHVFMQTIDVQRQANLSALEMNAMRNEFKESHDANIALGAMAVQRSKETIRDVIEHSAQKLYSSSLEPKLIDHD
jgi:hypothetical protein